MYRRCEDYAMWTLPYLFPSTGHKDSEMQGPKDSIGPRAVNNLANKLTLTLFPAHTPFIRLNASDDEVLGAEVFDLLLSLVAHAFAHSDQGNYRGNPDQNTQYRQGGAKLVKKQAVEPQAKRINESMHD